MHSHATDPPYVLRIGVTGHRKLPDPGEVERAAKRLVEHVGRTLAAPDGDRSKPPGRRARVEWVVVSPLAAGADRIVARAVLAQPAARLEVITPFPLADYRKDFKAPGDRAEFEELLCLDPDPTVLENDYGEVLSGDAPERIEQKKALRNEGYFDVGRRVVDGCEVLIAVWNGQAAAGRGGTGDIVRYALEQGRTVLWIDSQHPSAPARWIVGWGPDAGQAGAEPLVCRRLPALAEALCPAFRRSAGGHSGPGQQ